MKNHYNTDEDIIFASYLDCRDIGDRKDISNDFIRMYGKEKFDQRVRDYFNEQAKLVRSNRYKKAK